MSTCRKKYEVEYEEEREKETVKVIWLQKQNSFYFLRRSTGTLESVHFVDVG